MKGYQYPRIPKTRKATMIWHSYNIAMSRECRAAGYAREAAIALNQAAIARLSLQYFIPDGKEPF
ncbi:hypothetical protein SOASR030_01740 [Leminorella grimontii]|uniref:Uncharacterized protein n=1 Tax=Leminorella grimontii TaxID=82981 RepID=A0AAV5N0T4_9GAMM|nr:hypothetical protein SOASR030_01740 [Leminorella grimontii]VFS60168.1 Uncharacterised protein [Leminorella grimontii]